MSVDDVWQGVPDAQVVAGMQIGRFTSEQQVGHLFRKEHLPGRDVRSIEPVNAARRYAQTEFPCREGAERRHHSVLLRKLARLVVVQFKRLQMEPNPKIASCVGMSQAEMYG